MKSDERKVEMTMMDASRNFIDPYLGIHTKVLQVSFLHFIMRIEKSPEFLIALQIHDLLLLTLNWDEKVAS